MSLNLKLLFVVTEDWYFCSHRLALAIKAKKAGFEVIVATRVQNHGEKISEAGLQLIPLKCMVRGKHSLFGEIRCINELVSVYRKISPDILHHVAMKPMLYGSLAAKIVGIKRKVQAISGFGFVFVSDSLKARVLRPLIRLMLSYALVGRNTEVIVQNTDDAKLAMSIGVKPDHLHLIEGSGVNTHIFSMVEEPSNNDVVITLVSRMLWDKGVGEFVNAVQILKDRGLKITARLVGEPDMSNPASITIGQLQRWHKNGVVSWEGRQNDIAWVWSETNIAVLPSYREGLPKSLLEAAACGRAMVATDVPGCRSVVMHDETGLLVPPKNTGELALAIERLVNDSSLRAEMGKRARQLAIEKFSDDIVNNQVVDLYRCALGNR